VRDIGGRWVRAASTRWVISALRVGIGQWADDAVDLETVYGQDVATPNGKSWTQLSVFASELLCTSSVGGRRWRKSRQLG
jgi:hypothetical protein